LKSTKGAGPNVKDPGCMFISGAGPNVKDPGCKLISGAGPNMKDPGCKLISGAGPNTKDPGCKFISGAGPNMKDGEIKGAGPKFIFPLKLSGVILMSGIFISGGVKETVIDIGMVDNGAISI